MMKSWGPVRIRSFSIADPQNDPENWIVIPAFGVAPRPPWSGFDGYIEPGYLELGLELSAREVLRAARWRLRSTGLSLAEAQQMSAGLEIASATQARLKREATYYFEVIRSLQASYKAEHSETQRDHLQEAIATLRLWADPADVIAYEQRRRARSKRKRVQDSEIVAFARAFGIPENGKLPKAFVIDASSRFQVDRVTIRRWLKAAGYIT